MLVPYSHVLNHTNNNDQLMREKTYNVMLKNGEYIICRAFSHVILFLIDCFIIISQILSDTGDVSQQLRLYLFLDLSLNKVRNDHFCFAHVISHFLGNVALMCSTIILGCVADVIAQ